MEKEVIKSISEAFSMQPITITVDNKIRDWDINGSIQKIVLEKLDDSTNIYVGYNFDGKKLFQYLEKSVNVHYLV